MVANLISKKLQVFIGSDSQVWNLSYRSFEPVQDSWSDSGLITVTATLTIQPDLENPESISPRANPSRWKPSTPVRVKIQDSGGTWVNHPMGWLYILTDPDEPARGEPLTLNLGCPLVWFGQFAPDGDESGIVLGTSQNCAAIASTLLQAAGINSGSISLGTWPYTQAVPLSKSGVGSWVEQAGKLAYSNRRYLYCDPDGVVRAASLNLSAAVAPVHTVTLGTDDVANWEPASNGNPVELYQASGTNRVVVAADYSSTSEDIAGDPADYHDSCSGSITGNISVTYALNDNTTTFEFVKTTTTTQIRSAWWKDDTYGGFPCTISTLQVETDTETYDAATLRLTQKETKIEQPEAAITAKYGTGTQLRVLSRRTIDYSYSSNSVVSQVVDTTKQARHAVNGAMTGGISPAPDWTEQITNQVTSEYTNQGGEKWLLNRTTRVAKVVNNPGDDAYQSNPWALLAVPFSDSKSDGSTAPPQTQYWDGGNSIEERTYTGSASWTHPGGSTGLTRVSTISVPYGFSDAQMQAIAEDTREIVEGRWLAHTIPLSYNSDDLLTAAPLFRLDVVAPGGTYKYLADAMAWSHQVDRLELGCVGILLEAP